MVGDIDKCKDEEDNGKGEGDNASCDNSIASMKDNIRREAMRQRASMSANADELDDFSRLLFDSVQLSPKQIVAAYWPKDGEFDVREVIEHLINNNIPLALPVVSDGSRILDFALWNGKEGLVAGKYGIKTPPVNENTTWVEPDIFIVPLLAFDRRGYRLGYGGGYYDATLAQFRKKKKIVAVGAGYAHQACLFNLPVDEHDQPMDWIITPQQAYSFSF